MNLRHKQVLSAQTVVYDSHIGLLDAVYTTAANQTYTLAKFVCQLTFPLIPALDEEGKACDSDGKGNIKRDDKGKPIPVAKLFHEVTPAHWKQTGETAFTTQKQNQLYAQRVLESLPAICNNLLGGYHQDWFTPGYARKIVKETTFTKDSEGYWDGEWLNQSDIEMANLLSDDIGFGAMGIINFEGLELLDQQHDYVRPLDAITVETGSVATNDTLREMINQQEPLPPQQPKQTPDDQKSVVSSINSQLSESEDEDEDDEDEEMDEENNPNAMQEDPPLPQSSLTAGQSQNGSEPPESGSAGSLTQGAGPTV